MFDFFFVPFFMLLLSLRVLLTRSRHVDTALIFTCGTPFFYTFFLLLSLGVVVSLSLSTVDIIAQVP